ncbi:MAG TPA: hypothetical protein VGC41_19455, partial [Kofleriaceae bacterium]
MAAIVVGGVGTASAEPCAVQIARAPDDVRAAIETELANEHCTMPLTIRIVPTDGGYYIYAQDVNNVVHERVVPDGQSAGILIASWTADDGLIERRVEPAPIAARSHRAKHVDAAEPNDDDDDDDRDTGVAQHFDRGAHKWFTISGGAGGTNSGRGVRAEVEVVRLGGIALDVTLAYGGSDMVATDTFTTYFAHFDDLSATLGLHYTWRHDNFHLRGGFGAGVVTTQMQLTA